MAQDKDSNVSNKKSKADALIENYLGEFFAPVNKPIEESSGELASRPEPVIALDAELEREPELETDTPAVRATSSQLPRPGLAEKAEKPARRAFKARPAIKEFKPAPERTNQAVIPALLPKLKSVHPETKVENAKPIEPSPTDEQPSPKVIEPREAILAPLIETKAVSEGLKANVNEAAPSNHVTPRAKQEVAEETAATIAAPSVAEPPVAPPTSPERVSFRNRDVFDVLLFEVKGLQLAVPLISLGSIHKIESDFTPIFGRADWFMGMYHVNDSNLNVVDTARWVMPSRYSQDDREGYRFIIRLGDSNWALACNEVNQSVSLLKSEVKWRTATSKRPWLAGTVISRMCALLDVDSMAHLLDIDAMHE